MPPDTPPWWTGARRHADKNDFLQAKLKQEQARRVDALFRQRRIKEEKDVVDASLLTANPFPYQGRTVATRIVFEKMTSATEGIFALPGAPPSVIVTNIPAGFFRHRALCMVAGRVMGTAEATVPLIGRASMTKISFTGGYVCADWSCSDFGAK